MHERAVQVARRHLGASTSVAQIIAEFNRRGRQSLAKRLRSSARSRGALVHPGEELAGEVEAVLVQPSGECPESAIAQSVATTWHTTDLCDGRRLRRRVHDDREPPQNADAPSAPSVPRDVHPPTAAAPCCCHEQSCGNSIVCLRRPPKGMSCTDIVGVWIRHWYNTARRRPTSSTT